MNALTDSGYKQATPTGYVLLMFCADWCDKCPVAYGILSDLAPVYGYTLYAIDHDANPDAVLSYGIEFASTVIILRDGVPVDRIIGVTDRRKWIRILDRVPPHYS